MAEPGGPDLRDVPQALAAPTASVPVWVALGSNLGGRLGDRHAQLDAAERALAALASPNDSLRLSPRYETAAMSVPERPDEQQPDYLNAVAAFRTRLAPLELLDGLQAIETAAGRDRSGGQRWAARPLDLDLLLYDERQIAVERLTVPHPGIAERVFVLQPLADLDPSLRIPGSGPDAGPIGPLLARLLP